MKAYNFAVARDREPWFLTSYGDRLLSYTLPLLPKFEALNALTVKQLSEPCTIEGAGRERTTVFRKRCSADAIGDSVEGGDYYAPIVSDAGGNHAVNLSDLESFLTKMNGELTRLRQANAPNRGSGRGGFGYRGARGRGGFVGRGRATGGGNSDQARGQRDFPHGPATAPQKQQQQQSAPDF